jgi:hypothetical protein
MCCQRAAHILGKCVTNPFITKINVFETLQLLAARCAAIYSVMQPQCQSLLRVNAKKAKIAKP